MKNVGRIDYLGKLVPLQSHIQIISTRQVSYHNLLVFLLAFLFSAIEK